MLTVVNPHKSGWTPITEVTALETDAIDIIKELLNSEDDSIRLKAAELVLKFKL